MYELDNVTISVMKSKFELQLFREKNIENRLFRIHFDLFVFVVVFKKICQKQYLLIFLAIHTVRVESKVLINWTIHAIQICQLGLTGREMNISHYFFDILYPFF